MVVQMLTERRRRRRQRLFIDGSTLRGLGRMGVMQRWRLTVEPQRWQQRYGGSLGAGCSEQSELEEARWPVVSGEALRVFTVARARAVLEEELDVLEGKRKPTRGTPGMKRDLAQH